MTTLNVVLLALGWTWLLVAVLVATGCLVLALVVATRTIAIRRMAAK